MENTPPTNLLIRPRRRPGLSLRLLALAMLPALLALGGCQTGGQEEEPIRPPTLGEETMRLGGVFAVIREVDLPLDEPTDDAWAIVNEDVVPPLTRGVWQGNGMRLGVLRRDQLDAYTEVMPELLAFGETLINRSPHPVPIIETAQLRDDVRFQIDLTRPPMPRQVETVQGGQASTLRLLARIETEEDGQHTLVLTPQHYIPSPYDLLPRDPLEKELDGRVYEELTVRLTLGRDEIAVVALHWPWPEQRVVPELDEQGPSVPPDFAFTETLTIAPPDIGDPAAPPPHLRGSGTPGETQAPGEDAPAQEDQAEPAAPRFERVAPALPANFGSNLFTGTRIRQPVRTPLLITIERPDEEADAGEPAVPTIE